MAQKNDELMQVMKQMEEQKPKGWGFEKKAEGKTSDELVDDEHNLAKAIKKLEVDEKVKKYAKKDENQVQEILAESKVDESESMDDRVKKLIDHKKKLIEVQNKNREDQLR